MVSDDNTITLNDFHFHVPWYIHQSTSHNTMILSSTELSKNMTQPWYFLKQSVIIKKYWLPEESVAGEALPGSCLYFRCGLGMVVALLCLLHFLVFHRRSDFLPPLTTTSPFIIFFRNFFSTYLALIQASFSCLKNRTEHSTFSLTNKEPLFSMSRVPHLELLGPGFFRPCSSQLPS